MRRAAHVDANQANIVEKLREVGASVEPIHTQGRGCPDLLVGFRGCCFLLECKAPHGRLNARQESWHGEWQGQVAIVWTPWQALRVIGAVADESPSREVMA